jgi:hypothetical protein
MSAAPVTAPVEEVRLEGGAILRCEAVWDEVGRPRVRLRFYLAPHAKRFGPLSITLPLLTPRQLRALVDALDNLLVEHMDG